MRCARSCDRDAAVITPLTRLHVLQNNYTRLWSTGIGVAYCQLPQQQTQTVFVTIGCAVYKVLLGSGFHVHAVGMHTPERASIRLPAPEQCD
jgi:hypothetical protein